MIELAEYLKNPVYCEKEKPRFKVLLGLLFIYFVTAFVLGIFIVFLHLAFHLQERQLPFKTFLLRFLFVGLAAPVTEEILFRSWLKLKKGMAVLLLIFIFLFTFDFFLRSKLIPAFVTSAVFLGVTSLFIIYGREKINAFIVSHFKYLFYGSALVFGLLHATNFTGNPWIILAFSPILGSPQIIMGFFLGYIRMKNGLTYSILFHMAVNIIVFIL